MSSDQINDHHGGGSGREGADRSETRSLRSIIGHLEPKLREALREAQQAGRRERTAVTQLAHAKATAAEEHRRASEERAAAVAAAEAHVLDSAAEAQRTHEELHKAERIESTVRAELHDLRAQLPALLACRERYDAVVGENRALAEALGVMKESATAADREVEPLYTLFLNPTLQILNLKSRS
jgi:chromosome segregation ATPase